MVWCWKFNPTGLLVHYLKADPIEKGIPDLPNNAFFAYGYYEGIPRLLDLLDKHSIKLSSFMIGKAVETSPDIAKEIVSRGHEAAAHGRIWSNSYQLAKDEEKRFIADYSGGMTPTSDIFVGTFEGSIQQRPNRLTIHRAADLFRRASSQNSRQRHYTSH